MVHVFDLDGTLLDSNGIWSEIDETVIRGYGCELTEEYRSFVAHAIFPVAAKYTKDYYHLSVSEEEIMEKWHTLAMDAYALHLPLKANVKLYLDHCVKRAEKLVLYTTCEPSLCMAALKHHDINKYFSNIFFAQELRLEKIYPESFQKIRVLLDAPKEECLLYDDSPLVCAAAKRADWQVIGVYDSFFAEKNAQMQAFCNRFISDFSQLLPQT